MFDQSISLMTDAKKIVVVQAENPDGDSLGSALALEELLSDLGKEVVLYCAIDIPKYMHYISGRDRVTKDWPFDADTAVIVDTTSPLLLVKTLESPSIAAFLASHPVLVIDHHQEGGERFTFDHQTLDRKSVV
jgi:nanoRNase/pAp phosphatase (c-di-AMP/oligoRNAs hydrolase)